MKKLRQKIIFKKFCFYDDPRTFFRSSLSTLEEILWTSDSNTGSDFVIIKEDEQETVI